jgi:hypothetical protein
MYPVGSAATVERAGRVVWVVVVVVVAAVVVVVAARNPFC